MVKLQIGANTIYLTKQEQDFLFQLLDNNYDHIENSPTFNAIHNWLSELGCRPEVLKSKTPEEMQKEVADYFDSISKKVEKKGSIVMDDPWGNPETLKTKQELKDLYKEWSDVDLSKTTDYTALRKLLGELLKDDNEKGYYVAL